MSLAYQVTGDASLDLVFPAALGIPIDLLWDEPGFNRFAKRLGGFSRTVWCERRGEGASGGESLDFVEQIADGDLTAVLDAVGGDPVVLVGTGAGGPLAIRYTATHPERVKALVLINTYAHYVREDDYPWGFTPDALTRLTDESEQEWGTGGTPIETVAPSKTADEAFRGWYARSQRLSQGPDSVAVSLRASFAQDVRAMLPAIATPTLVVHREGNRYMRAGAGRYLAEHIPGAKYVELPGDDHFFFVGDTDALLDEVEQFLTGTRQAPEGDVVTATIMFTDIVASTEHSARLGHRKWTALTDGHDTMVRSVLARYRGREVKTIGDGFLATFDATTRAVRAATEIVVQAKSIGLEVRAGVHAGEVEVRPGDVVGLTVSIAKRICDLAGPTEVFVSEAVKVLIVGSGIALSDQGVNVLKGVPEEWRLFAVEG